MKWSILILISLFSLNSFSAVQCNEVLNNIVRDRFLGSPPDRFVNVFELYAPISNEAKADLKALATEILKNVMSENTGLYEMRQDHALDMISASLFSITLRRLTIRFTAETSGRMPFELNWEDEAAAYIPIYLKSDLETIISLLTDRQSIVRRFLIEEMASIISDAKNNVDTGLFQSDLGSR